MPANNIILISLVTAVLLGGCVEPYTPEIKESQDLLIVEGLLTDQPGYQYVYISRTSPFNDPRQYPVSDCQVRVVDESDNSFAFHEKEDGTYELWIDDGELTRDVSYKLIITLPNSAGTYESHWETLGEPCAPIDSLYYKLETVQTADPSQPERGIQFYIDVNTDNYKAQNYRWLLTETWEYRSVHYIQYYWDGEELYKMTDPKIYHTCWKTDRVTGIFASTTRLSDEKRIMGFPLNYVSDETNRLMHRYSLLVQQYTLSDDAYDYWDKMGKQLQESGGLYDTQPVQLNGNIKNINDPEEIVLGYFNVSSTSEKRVFTGDLSDLNPPGFNCELTVVRSTRRMPYYWELPIFMKSLSIMESGPPYGIGRGICFDCRTLGGTIEKPDFW